jgi:hypothetical protein
MMTLANLQQRNTPPTHGVHHGQAAAAAADSVLPAAKVAHLSCCLHCCWYPQAASQMRFVWQRSQLVL